MLAGRWGITVGRWFGCLTDGKTDAARMGGGYTDFHQAVTTLIRRNLNYWKMNSECAVFIECKTRTGIGLSVKLTSRKTTLLVIVLCCHPRTDVVVVAV